MPDDYRSGDALFAFGEDRRVCEWNREAEELTGIRAEDAIGRPCWEVLGAVDEDGGLICHPGCSRLRLMDGGWPVRAQRMRIRTDTGRKRVTVSSICLHCVDPPLYLHLLRNGEPEPEKSERPFLLTPRQLQVLGLLNEGRPVKTIAGMLGITQTTVRNHVQAILLEMGCHSQLEALAKARRLGLISAV